MCTQWWIFYCTLNNIQCTLYSWAQRWAQTWPIYKCWAGGDDSQNRVVQTAAAKYRRTIHFQASDAFHIFYSSLVIFMALFDEPSCFLLMIVCRAELDSKLREWSCERFIWITWSSPERLDESLQNRTGFKIKCHARENEVVKDSSALFGASWVHQNLNTKD